MPRRRYKPTFLLKCVVFVFVIGTGFGAFAIASAAGSGLPLLIAFGTGAILILLSDLIIWGVIALMTRHAEHSSEQSSPLWFTDTEEAKRHDAERFHEDTKDNPTLR
jgi:hypothetical protein